MRTCCVFESSYPETRNAHCRLCLTIGQGSLVVPEGRSPCLGDKRFGVICAVAKNTKTKACGPFGDEGWPLWLPYASRMLVITNLANELITVDNREADWFIVNGTIALLKHLSGDMSILQALDPPNDDYMIRDQEIPFSLSDARIFLLALTRLKAEDQKKSFESFIRVVHKMVENAQEQEHVLEYRQVGCLFSRIAVLLTNLAPV